jgi:hypothetical protein
VLNISRRGRKEGKKAKSAGGKDAVILNNK